MDGSARNRQRSLLWVGALLAAALAVRLVYLGSFRGDPFFDHPIIDAAEYYGWARTIAGGEWLWNRVHIHGPLYPFLLAILMKMGASFRAFYLLNHLLGVATLFLIYDVGRLWKGKTVGFLAAGAALLYPRFLFFEGLLLATTVAVFLNALLLRTAIGLERKKAPPPWWIVAGVLVGLSSITRPTVLIAVPLLLLWSFRSARRREGALRCAYLLAGIVLIVGPVFVRNAQVESPVLVQANAGLNFYVGNRAGGDGLATLRPGIEWNEVDRLADDAGYERAGERDRFYYRKGIEEMAQDPAAAAGRIIKRALLFWGGWEVDTSHNLSYFRERIGVIRLLLLPAGVILPLALAGVIGAFRRGPLSNLPLLFVLSYFVVILPFLYASRYRMPVFPIFLLFAAHVLVSVVRRWRAGARPWKEIAFVAALFLLLNAVPLDLPGDEVARIHLHLGKRLYDRGDLRGALAEYDLALKRNGEDADVWNNRGLALEALGDRTGARAAYETALRYAPDHGKAMANVAGILYQKGEVDSALTVMEEAVRLRPRNPDFRNNLGALLLQMGRVEEAVATLERGAALDPRHKEVLYNLGRAYERAGRFAEAAGTYQVLLRLGGGKEVHLRLGGVGEKMNRPDMAAAEYMKAIQIDPRFDDALRGIGILLLRMERTDEALHFLERYLAVRPEDEGMRRLVDQVRRGEGPPASDGNGGAIEERGP
jgi:tetratricopeptide (TPR) repeat protein